MAYGSGQRLGESIDPRLMQVDFSPIERAGAVAGQALQGLAGDITAGIKEYKNKEKFLKKSEQMAKSIREAIPELAPMADEALASLNNPDLSLNDRLGIAEGIQDSLKIGVLGLEQRRSDSMLDLERQKLAASMMGSQAPTKLDLVDIPTGDGGTKKMKYDPYSGQLFELTDPRAEAISGALDMPTDSNMPDGVDMGNTMPIPDGTNSDMGVSIDGSPGVLPPKPIGGGEAQLIQQAIPKKGEFGYTPPDKEQWVDLDPQEAATKGLSYGQRNAITGEIKGKGLASGEIVSVDKDGNVTITRGAQATKGQKTPEELAKAKQDFSSYVEQMAGSYSQLDKKGGAVRGGESSVLNFLSATEPGQTVARARGSEDQVFRDQINTMRPNIVNVIRQFSEMGAKGLDSEKELAFYLSALGDPKLPVEANIKALEKLDKVYGDGKAVQKILADNPDLAKRVRSYDLKYQDGAKSEAPLQLNQETEDLLKSLGL